MVEGELMLRELEHRSANGMAVALAALTLARNGRVTPEQLDAAIGRVSAVAALDASLARPVDASAVRLGPSLGVLARGLELAWPGLRVDLSAPDLPVSAADAHRVALLVAELVANAARHGYGGSGGLVRVVVGDDGGRTEVAVADDGALTGWTRSGGRGSGIVDGLAALMDGTVVRGSGARGGATVSVGMPSIAICLGEAA